MRHLVAGATEDIQRIRGAFGQRGTEATFADGIGGDVGRLVVAVEISEIPIKSVQHGALGSEQYGVGIVGDVRLARSNVHRTVVKGDIDAEGIPIVRLGHEDTVVRCGRNGRRGQLNMRLVLLVGQRRVEVDVLRQIITECGIEPEALGFRREPDEVLEIVEVGRRRDTGRQPLRLKRGGGRSVELTVGRVPRSASEVRRRRSERAGDCTACAGQARDHRTRRESGDIDSVLPIDLAGRETGESNAGLRTGPGALIEIAHRNDRRVAVFRVFSEIARREIGIVGEGGVLGGQSRPVKIGHPDRRAALAGGGPGEKRVILLGDIGLE